MEKETANRLFICINFYLLSKKSAILNLYSNNKNYCG